MFFKTAANVKNLCCKLADDLNVNMKFSLMIHVFRKQIKEIQTCMDTKMINSDKEFSHKAAILKKDHDEIIKEKTARGAWRRVEQKTADY